MERPEIFSQLFYCLLTGLALIGPGMMMGYSGVAIPLLSNETTSDCVTLTDTQQTWFASIVTISIPLGSVMSLFTLNRGRRFALYSAGIILIAGWIWISISGSVEMLLVGRFITGLSGGLIATPGSVYLAEISSVELRTVLTPSTSLFISMGSMFVYYLALITKTWRLVAIISIFVPVLSVIFIYFLLPESPRWLLSKGRKQEAKSALLRLRGLDREDQRFMEEFESMIIYNDFRYTNQNVSTIELPSENVNHNNPAVAKDLQVQLRFFPALIARIKKELRSCAEILRIPQVWKPLIIINGFFMAQQLCGLYVIMAYTVKFLELVGVKQDANVISVLVGLIQIASCVLLMIVSDKIGRRPIAITSGAGMSVALLTLGIHQQFYSDIFRDWLPLACIIVYELTGSFGYWSLPWAIIGEIYPTKYVNYLGPFTALMCGIYNFTAVQLYPTLQSLGSLAVIYSFAAVCVSSTAFLILVLPETFGKTKAEIEKQF